MRAHLNMPSRLHKLLLSVSLDDNDTVEYHKYDYAGTGPHSFSESVKLPVVYEVLKFFLCGECN